MSINRQWLDQGLGDGLERRRADRVRLFRAVLGTAALLRGQVDRALAPSGITTQQAALLQCVEAQPAPPTMGQVAQAMSMTHQNVKQIALVLQRKGFLQIETDQADRRARRLVLTEHHHRFWRERNPADFDLVEQLTAALDDAEVRTLVALLARLREPLRDGSPDQSPTAT
jgi:DNA-binding MarR family transcriptional regulator